MTRTKANEAMNPMAPVNAKKRDDPMNMYPKNMAVEILFVTSNLVEK